MTADRLIATAIALGVFVTIATRIWLRMDGDGESFGQAVWHMYRYYTIWTNTLIGIACAAIALGHRVTFQNLSNLLLSIIIVAVVYHALLAHLYSFTGLDAFVDSMLHTIIPLAFAVFWLIQARRSASRYRDILPWLGLPLVYCIYAMTRAQFDGVYPYFFLDLAALGAVRTAVNVLGLLIAFAGIGAGIVILNRLLVRSPVGRQV